MPLCVQELHRRGLDFPVIVGGAAINRAFGQRILFVGDDGAEAPYDPGVFYARDAFEGLAIMDHLSDPELRSDFVTTVKEQAATARAVQANRDSARATQTATIARPKLP